VSFQGKRVVILGLARQGTALARYLARQGARVTVSDLRPAAALGPALAELADLTIEYVLGGHPESLLDGADLLCLSGGVPANGPLAQEARRRGVPLSNDSQIFLEATPARVVGITGSAGKTTTTTLVGVMLKDEGGGRKDELHPLSFTPQPSSVWVGGNIGHPLIADVEQMQPGDLAVMELSSFQLEIMTVSPPIAAVLNLTPNHLDRHRSLEAYVEAKSRILRFQQPDDIAVLGWDDPATRRLAAQAQGRLAWFSTEAEVSQGAWVRNGQVVLRQEGQVTAVCPVQAIRLRGAHNRLNVLAACAIAGAAGAAPEAMRAAIEGFIGVEHRLEFVRERGGVKWYNDSIATAPERAAAAILSFDEPIVLLAGGRDKDLPWEELARLVKRRVRHLIVFGEAAGLIERAVRREGYEAITACAGLAEAVQAAARIAQPGEVALLAPGGTSFDEFIDFAERGVKFKELVRAL
jgi:UDP-N-acetylmuramoylalanine--D-glutamate ligase